NPVTRIFAALPGASFLDLLVASGLAEFFFLDVTSAPPPCISPLDEKYTSRQQGAKGVRRSLLRVALRLSAFSGRVLRNVGFLARMPWCRMFGVSCRSGEIGRRS